MTELFVNYYNLFNHANGDNTCFEFTVSTVIILALIGYQIYCEIKNKKSIFF